MLSLERDPVALPIQAPVLANDGAGEKVAGVEMNSGLGRRELEHSTRARVLESSGRAQLSPLPAEREIVVVAASDRELRLGSVADSLGASSISGR